jgi:hypothetical protein
MIETMAKMSMGLLLAASVPVGADTEVWAQWGLAGLVVAYVLWRDANRERRMSVAIEHQQRWLRETLVATLDRNAKAMERMATWLEVHEHPSRAITKRLRTMEDADADHG